MSQEVCNALLSYYNTSILDNPKLDSTLKEQIYIEAEKCADDNRARGGTLERTVLKSLIVNHKVNAKPVAPYIAGPYSLSLHWSEVYKKLIYIFGEAHNSTTDCNHYGDGITGMLIEDYLAQLFTYSDAFIDFYHECHGYYKTSTYEDPIEHIKELRLYKIWEKIKKCIDKSTRDLEGNNCQKGRMHYIDIRTMNGIKVNNSSAFTRLYINFATKLKGLPDKKVELFNEFFNQEQVIKLLQDLSKIEKYNDEKIFKFFEDEFDHYEIYNKQVGKSSIQNKIKQFIKEKLINTDPSIIRGIMYWISRIKTMTEKYEIKNVDLVVAYKFTDDISSADYTELNELLGLVSEYLVDINYLIVDGYLFGRIFKTFDIDTQVPNKQRPTDEPDEPHNIIIYAGYNHSNNYRRFLDKLEFIPIKWVGQDWTKVPEHPTRVYETYENHLKPANCIDMQDFPQPFFSKMDGVNWLSNIVPVKQTIDKKSQPDKLGIKKSSIGRIDKGKRDTKKGKSKLNKKSSQESSSSGDEMESDYNSSGDESETMDVS